MIKKVRLKFIVVTMMVLLLLLVAILASLNIFMGRYVTKQLADLLTTVASNNGELEPGSELLGDYFAVKIDQDGAFLELINKHQAVSDLEAKAHAEGIATTWQLTGEIDTLSYVAEDKPYGRILVFADRRDSLSMLGELRKLSYWIGILSSFVIFGLAYLLARWATKPLEESLAKQRDFITDSSHELITPLAILVANADILEEEIGEHSCLTQIKQQAKRLSKLVDELSILAKMEKQDHELMDSFDLSQAVLSAVLPFDIVAYDQNKNIVFDITEGIHLLGDKNSIKKMVEALVENAVMYANPYSSIMVRLWVNGAKRVLEVYNEGQGVTIEQQARMFETFYRADDQTTDGYGIGLAIVQSVVDAHKGKIEVESHYGEDILFRIIL